MDRGWDAACQPRRRAIGTRPASNARAIGPVENGRAAIAKRCWRVVESPHSRTLCSVSTATLRNIAIILALAAVVYFAPGGGDAAALIGGLLSTAILASFVMLAARFYRERRMDIVGLGNRWRAIFYGALAVIVLAMAARPRLIETGGGTLLWLAAVAGSGYAIYRVWRHYREYA
jgi:O-antigen/teichoic acid export membrane protein